MDAVQSANVNLDVESLLPAGYTMRAMRLEDIATVVEFVNHCTIAQAGQPEFSEEEFRRDVTMPGVSLARDTRVVLDPTGQIVGYQDVTAFKEPPMYPYAFGYTHPDHENLGLGTTMLTWAEQRARAYVPQVPGELRVALRASALSTHEPSYQLLQGFGMRYIRSGYRMVRELGDELPAPEWPEGITLLEVNPERDARAIYRAMKEGFRDHWGYQPQPEETDFPKWQHHMMGDEFDPTIWFVALDGDQIAGLSLCQVSRGEDPDMGWLAQLTVRRPWRRQGLALALLHHTFREFHKRGQKRVGLGVDAGSITGAVRLYERAGMYIKFRGDTYEKELRPGDELA